MRRRALVVAACVIAGVAALYCGVDKRATQPPVEPTQSSSIAPDAPRVELETSLDLESASELQRATTPRATHFRPVVIPELRGVVRWTNGAPASRATVELGALSAARERREALAAELAAFNTAPREEDPTVRADEGTAEFRFERVAAPCFVSATAWAASAPAGEPAASARLAPGGANSLWSTEAVLVDETTRFVVLTLRPGVKLTSSVHDDAGNPIDRYWLSAHRLLRLPNGELVDHSLLHPSRSASDGLGTGIWELVAVAEGFTRSTTKLVELRDAPVTVDFVVQRPGEVSGRLVDAEGQPCVLQWVGVVSDDVKRWLSWDSGCYDYTDANGEFRVERVRPGRVRLRTLDDFAVARHTTDWFELAPGEKRTGVNRVLAPR